MEKMNFVDWCKFNYSKLFEDFGLNMWLLLESVSISSLDIEWYDCVQWEIEFLGKLKSWK